ncbi:HEAT repeat domain-containing protein [Leucobacter tenebrionis]|uniref:HEAT repeat domain-containing protein n=1 Tax=Leucobacter tenebrionis TaxID=2873270 RepID=UPI001CA6C847|nr:HEAT repeat domain-containing protein [Leucobacter tenebrionis]QZY52382.1 HEAT repeat domain-containing protein [Leucobacter tenebrionis]
MSGGGARSRADIDPVHLGALNSGAAPSRTLAEALAIDHTVLLRSVLPDADAALRAEVADAQGVGILKRMTRIGEALAARLDAAEVERISRHPSDTVRGWGCFLIAARNADAGPVALLERLRAFADDEHFAVREWVWMAARPVLVTDLDTSIDVLARWTADPSERVRRFASEALRPRGVWAAHIDQLKQHPEKGEPILHPLRADSSRYVQDSVANWINDAAKTRPDWAAALCAGWSAESDSAATARLVKRALRSLGPA